MASTYRVSKQAFGHVLDQVCDAICEALQDQFKLNMKKEDWVDIANQYHSKWNYPNCLGAIDGKHIQIKRPLNAGSVFYNYKGFHSIILLAIADANYRFIAADIGAYGSEGDASLFNGSEMGKAIKCERLDLPENARIGSQSIPFHFIADDAFPLSKRIMKPFKPPFRQELNADERIFNYRLSRARRCIENAFGILSAKFQCLRGAMLCSPDRAQKIVVTCCLLHNYLMSSTTYCPIDFADSYGPDGEFINGSWRTTTVQLQSICEQDNSIENQPKKIRNSLKEYFNSEVGSVSWQNKSVFAE